MGVAKLGIEHLFAAHQFGVHAKAASFVQALEEQKPNRQAGGRL